MSFFPRAFIAAESTAASNPLFRLLEDLDSCSRPVTRHTARPCVRVNTPRFNIEEFEAQYELTGEFPGFDHSSLNIEFSDPQTLTIRAQTDREEKLSAPAQSGTATTAEPTDATAEVRSASPHQPTVEDEDNEKDTFVDVEKPQMNSPPTTSAPQQALAPQQAPTPAPKPVQKPRGTFHAYERRVGDYYREFKFPVRVEADAVTASMKNGILTVVVPKAPKYESRRVTVN